jgi:uncharacterized protein (UPF0332 family)
MSFDWRDYLKLAGTLASAESEAARRTAVSRAYYAAYHQAKIYLTDTTQLNGEKHEHVIAVLKHHRMRDQRDTGLQLERLKRFRESADYIQNQFDVKPAEVIATAEKVVGMLARFPRN